MEEFTVTVDAELEVIMSRYFTLQWADLAGCERALARGDIKGPRLFGHKLKGTGASYGFPRLTELGAAVEQAALAGDLAGVSALTAEVRAFLAAVRVVYAGREHEGPFRYREEGS
jgi:HPt (histidine-containing phosphotransfer) domain-containing protein